jgi:septal ring factor EnvC (AmiA/AmiB activator)
MDPEFALVADGLLAVLLLATLVYVARLNRRLGQIRDARQEFEALIARFAEATAQADRSIAGVKAAAAAEGKELQATIDRSRGLRDDLAFLADKANGLADQLEAAIGRARGAVAARVPPAATDEKPAPVRRPASGKAPGQPPRENRAAFRGEPLSDGERDLLRALSSVR